METLEALTEEKKAYFREEVPSSWRYSTLHPPGMYSNRHDGKVYWSGEPRKVDTWWRAEWNAAAQLRALCYFDTELTSPNTKGIDLQSKGMTGQVKHLNITVGLPHLVDYRKEARRQDHYRELWYFSGCGYSESAVEYANEHDIRLFVYSLTGALEAMNEIAETTLQRCLKKRARLLSNQEKEENRWAFARKWFFLQRTWEEAGVVNLGMNTSHQEREAAEQRQRDIAIEINALMQQHVAFSQQRAEDVLESKRQAAIQAGLEVSPRSLRDKIEVIIPWLAWLIGGRDWPEVFLFGPIDKNGIPTHSKEIA